MKKKFKTMLIIILLIGVFIFPVITKADSGFDSSYDSGGSYDYGSSYDWGDSSYDHNYGNSNRHKSYSNSESSSIIVLIVKTLFVFGALIYTYHSFKRQTYGYVTSPNPIGSNISLLEVDDSILNKMIINFDKEKLKEQIYQHFVELQIAWMNFDDKKLRELLNDEMYNMYTMQLQTLKFTKQQNIMSDFENIGVKITEIKEDKNLLTMVVFLDIKFYDYIINSETKEIVKGNSSKKMNNLYRLVYVRYINSLNYEVTCPNCGNKLKVNSTGKCEYCSSIIVAPSDTWVLSKKEIKRQK